jgi:hypothetical protein
MKRENILSLQQPQWEAIVGSDLEVEIVPAEAPDFSMYVVTGTMTPEMQKYVCQRAFIDFKHYTNGTGEPIANTLDVRLELFGIPAIRSRIVNLLQQANNEVLTGEADAASD